MLVGQHNDGRAFHHRVARRSRLADRVPQTQIEPGMARLEPAGEGVGEAAAAIGCRWACLEGQAEDGDRRPWPSDKLGRDCRGYPFGQALV